LTFVYFILSLLKFNVDVKSHIFGANNFAWIIKTDVFNIVVLKFLTLILLILNATIKLIVVVSGNIDRFWDTVLWCKLTVLLIIQFCSYSNWKIWNKCKLLDNIPADFVISVTYFLTAGLGE